MDNTATPPSGKCSAKPRTLTFEKAGEILWESAWEALVLAFLVLVVGGVVVGLAGGLWRQMVPSLPPGVAGKPLLENPASMASGFGLFQQHRFAFIFAILFIGKAAARLAGHSPNEQHRRAAAGLQRVFGRVSDQWFRLIVVNAFVALITAVVIEFAERFSPTRFLWQAIVELCRPVIQAVAGLFTHHGPFGLIQTLAGWYHENQLKFMFWFFYSAAICDDLGLPNFKTLGRLLWRRCFGRKSSPGKS